MFFSHFADLPHYGMVYGHYSLAYEWARMGHEVTIVAASFAHSRFRQPAASATLTEEIVDGIRYFCGRCQEYAPSGQMERVRNILALIARTMFGRFQITDADIVISSSYSPFTIFSARKWANWFGARLVSEVRDIWPLTLIELAGASPGHPFIHLMQRSEDDVYRVTDRVVSVLPEADWHMLVLGMSADKFLCIPKGADLECKGRQPLPADYVATIRQLKEDGHFLLGYVGRLGLANAMHNLLDALIILDAPYIHAVLLGEGCDLENLKQQIDKLGLKGSVRFLPFVPKTQVESFLYEMIALHVGFFKQSLYRFGSSVTKLNDYMLTAKPSVCAIDAEEEGVEEAGAGLLSPTEDPQAIAGAVDKMSRFSGEK